MGRGRSLRYAGLLVLLCLIIVGWRPGRAHAITLTSSSNVSVTATVLPTAPTDPAVIDQPQNNVHLTTTPLVVIGRCQAGTTVRIFNNGQLAGSVTCASDNTFTANITLGIGQNVLTSLNYDAFDQAGPVSPSVTIYVDQPVKTSGPAVVSAAIQQAVGTTNPPAEAAPLFGVVALDPNSPQRIFEGTIIEPVAKVLDLQTTVAASTNGTISTAVNTVFIGGFVLLLILVIL